MSDLEERIARGFALREQHPDWSIRTVIAALDHGEDSPEVHDSIARNVALMKALTQQQADAENYVPPITDEQMRVLRKMIGDSVRITIYHGEPPGMVGFDSQPLLGPRGSVWVEWRALDSFGWCVIAPDGTVRK